MVRIYPVAIFCIALSACSSVQSPAPQAETKAEAKPVPQIPPGLPGMPPVTDPNDIYAADHAGMLSPAVQNVRRGSTFPTAAATPWT